MSAKIAVRCMANGQGNVPTVVCGLYHLSKQCLNRVNHRNRWLLCGQCHADGIDIGLSQYSQAVSWQAKSLGAHRHLRQALFARDLKRRA